MTAPFDPYHKWLGIPPAEQPPNHYRLLGIGTFESDPDVIDAAAEQRMTFLRTCAGGAHVADSQRLLNEVAAARLCLLSPATKAAYDAALGSVPSVASRAAQPPTARVVNPVAAAQATAIEPRGFEPIIELVRRDDRRFDAVAIEPRALELNIQTTDERIRTASRRTKPLWQDWRDRRVQVGAAAVLAVCVAIYLGASASSTATVPDGNGNASSSAGRSDKDAPVQSGVDDQGKSITPPFKGSPDASGAKEVTTPRPAPKNITNSIGMELVLIPAGEFEMGAAPGESGASDTERPQHKVRITRPFYMGRYEVTQAEYARVMSENPSWFSLTGNGKVQVTGQDTGRCPVEMVSWLDAQKFCKKLSETEAASGRRYRLPTEAEWEYACRAGTTSVFHWGNELSGGETNCDGNSPYGTAVKGPVLGRTTPVGSYQRPNAFGLHDMHGNVCEWCADWFDAEYYKNSPAENPTGPAAGVSRVLRGGGWYNFAVLCRSAYHYYFTPTYRDLNIGFRVVCEQSGSDGESNSERSPLKNSPDAPVAKQVTLTPPPPQNGTRLPLVPLELLDTPMPKNDAKPAIRGWKSRTAYLPFVVSNASNQPDHDLGKVPPHKVAVHPTPSEFVAAVWTSPFAGQVRVAARITHANPSFGNGIAWSLERRRGDQAFLLDAGAIDLGKGAEAAIREFEVAASDVLMLAIDARDANHVCDLTEIDFTITEVDQAAPNQKVRVWDLAGDVADTIPQGNPHADRFGNKAVWQFVKGPARKPAELTYPGGETPDEMKMQVPGGQVASKPPIGAIQGASPSNAPPPPPKTQSTPGAVPGVKPPNPALPLPKNITNTIGMQLVLIPPGEFQMGPLAGESGASGTERPQHKVRITRPFYMGRYEVTQVEYARVMSANPSWFSANGGDKDKVTGRKARDTSRFPVEMVSWLDAQEFCKKLSETETEAGSGRRYRLPTEAEWEYACRARTTIAFHWGDELSGLEANCNGNYPYGTMVKGPLLGRTLPVGSYRRPNAFGLHDMHGNVCEWCADWFGAEYYKNSPAENPTGPAAGVSRVLRGGGWNNGAVLCRSADRGFSAPTDRSGNTGFRVVCER